jgi:NADH-quinone oxidoreductase subunit H
MSALLATDPLFASGVHWAELAIVAIKVLVAFAVLMVAVMLMIWFERKAISDMQSRIGPQRWGPFGILQTLADGIKLFFKEDLVPRDANRIVFKLAPYLVLIPALLTFCIVPVGGEVTVAGHTFYLQVADPPIGILLLLAMSGISVYGVILAGWGSGSKYPLMSSVRASAQMISYEAALGLSTATVVLVAGTLSTNGIVAAQAHGFWHWNVIRLGVVPFIVFLVAITAEVNRPPFDTVEAESELVGGFHTEYASIRFALFFLAEFMNTITMSAIMVTLFFGGPQGWHPDIRYLNWLFPILWFVAKTTVFCFCYVWARGALPRFRYDQLMSLGWKQLIPISFAWLLLIAGFLIDVWWGIAIAGGVLACALLLGRAFELGDVRERGEDAILDEVAERPVPPWELRRQTDEGVTS